MAILISGIFFRGSKQNFLFYPILSLINAFLFFLTFLEGIFSGSSSIQAALLWVSWLCWRSPGTYIFDNWGWGHISGDIKQLYCCKLRMFYHHSPNTFSILTSFYPGIWNGSFYPGIWMTTYCVCIRGRIHYEVDEMHW